MRRDRIAPPCRGSDRRTSPSCAPVHPYCHPLRARGPGRGLPAATGSLANAIGRAKTAEGLGRAFSPAFRARAWVPKNLARRVLIYWFRRRDAARPDRAAMPRIGPANLSIMRPRSPLLSPSTRARARPWSARCYGVARQRDRSRQNSRGPRACFLSGISGSRVGAEESGAANFDLLVSAARCGATGSRRHAADRTGEPLHRAPPFAPTVTLYAREGQAVVCPLLRGRSPTRSVAPKQPRASGVLSLRHFGLARGCRSIWRGEFCFIVLGVGMGPDRIDPPCRGSGRRTSPSRRPRLPLLSPSTRARARPWSARCYGVARQRDRSRQNSRGPRACFLSGISGSRVGAEESGAASFDLLVSAARCGATGSGRHAADRAGEPLHRGAPVYPSVTLYAREGQAVVCPLLRGRSPTRSVVPKQPRPPCRGSGRRTSPSCAPVNPFCHPLRARGQAVVCPLLRGRSPTRSVVPKQPRAS